MGFLYIIFVSILLFGIYIEISPGLGNIWFRTNSLGYKVIRLDYFLIYLIEPFKNKILWHYKLWDTNSIIFITVMTLFIYFIKK